MDLASVWPVERQVNGALWGRKNEQTKKVGRTYTSYLLTENRTELIVNKQLCPTCNSSASSTRALDLHTIKASAKGRKGKRESQIKLEEEGRKQPRPAAVRFDSNTGFARDIRSVKLYTITTWVRRCARYVLNKRYQKRTNALARSFDWCIKQPSGIGWQQTVINSGSIQTVRGNSAYLHSFDQRNYLQRRAMVCFVIYFASVCR